MNTYPQIDLSAWKQVGEGGNGAAYVNDAEPGVLLKVNTLDTSARNPSPVSAPTIRPPSMPAPFRWHSSSNRSIP